LQVLEHPAAVVTGLDADALQAFATLRQLLAARDQGLGQRLLMHRRDVVLDHLGEPQGMGI
jgi:hypothetical protein